MPLHIQKSKKARSMLRMYIPHLQFAGQNVAYGYMEGYQLQLKISEMSKQYQQPSGFHMFSFSDLDNPRSVHLTVCTTNNRSFPATSSSGSEHWSNGREFMEYLASSSTVVSEGSIDGRRWDCSAHASSAINDPVTFVTESKHRINDICFLLLGLPLESFYA